MNKIAFLFPGQGSQYTGMGRDLYEHHPEVRALFEEASETTAMNMTDLCFKGPDEVLKRTENAQPAVALVNAACLSVLKQEGIAPQALAGHSLGEYTALYAAGAMAFGTMMDLVRKRALFMQEAAEKNPGTMVAVIGLEAEKVATICKEALPAGYVAPANFNAPLQTILTGEAGGIEKAVELLKKAGARMVIPLKVSGAWHSKFMVAAGGRMRAALAAADINRVELPVVANATARRVSAPEEIREALERQMSAPVLWSASMRRLIDDGLTTFVEVGPGKVLKGLMREIVKHVAAYNVENTDTLNTFLASEKAHTA
ncbi:MAG: ACP S-malonyltransferase [Pseudomonadota bacterium]|nr:ACP S-malonyltransferase [Pseudomonadota bacterium]